VPAAPRFPAEDTLGILPLDRSKPYDMHQVLARILDDSELDEYKCGFRKKLITGFARIDGSAVGIVANQRSVVRNAAARCRWGVLSMGTVPTRRRDSLWHVTRKWSHWCFPRMSQGLWRVAVPSTEANSVGPMFTFIVGNSYGAGNYAMCGKSYGPRMIFAWLSAQIAVMGGGRRARRC
jgi:3-methylcrotonyl-CoA carboxylase beta subunit